MALITYTTYDTIRSLLGINAKELADSVLALPIYEEKFLLDMSEIDNDGGAVMSMYDTIAAIDPGSRTAVQQRYYTTLGLVAAYSVARQLLGPSKKFSPNRITDGRAEIERDEDTKERLIEGVQGTYDTLIRRLKAVLLILDPSANITASAGRTLMVSTGLATDPVTGV